METVIPCAIGAGIWWLLTSQLSAQTWMFAGVVLVFVMVGVVVWWVFWVSEPEPESQPQVVPAMPKAAIENKKP